jgi:(2R)-3-sulfolactate dehydrogenase (NADP+)
MSAHILSAAEIAALTAQALRNHGASESQAVALAAGVAAAERDGLRSHGLMYLPTYCEHLTCGKVVGQAVRAPEVTTCTYTRKRGRP